MRGRGNSRLLCGGLREEFDFPIFMNADHTHSLAKGLEAVKAGFDSVVFDLSALPIETNALSTKQAVEALKSVNQAVVIEGEIGDIGSGSEIHADGPGPDRALTTVEDARQFVAETKVDVRAPAVGNSHGMRKNMVTGKERKHLAIERIREIKSATCVPLTLHGGSHSHQHGTASGVETRTASWSRRGARTR